MTFHGRVQKGVIVLDDPKALPEGTEVSVRALQGKPPRRRGKTKVSKGLLKLSGAAKNLPADASRNIDHYLYGHSKR
jgi:hypothetical protein